MMGYDLHMELPMVKDNEARYVAVFDPIDGSKNIGASLPVGTIFSIICHDSAGMDDGNGIHGFTLDPGGDL